MKYYSEITGELFDTVEKLRAEEEKILKREAEKEKASKEVEEAYKKAVKACDDYFEVVKKYGKNYRSDDLFGELIRNLFEQFGACDEIWQT